MKLRLTQPGFETYTGQMGVVFFEDGLSTTDVRPLDAVRMAAQFLCEWEDGTTASVAQSLLDHANTPAPVFLVGEKQHDQDALNAGTQVEPGTTATSAFTEEELSKIADEQGIKGLREIAEPLGIKGNSIKELIAALAKASAPKA